MTVQLDTATGTCSVVIGETKHRSAIMDVRITTDPQARMDMLHIDGATLHVTAEEAENLIAAGAIDDRSLLVADD